MSFNVIGKVSLGVLFGALVLLPLAQADKTTRSFVPTGKAKASGLSGEQIYTKMCVQCHGPQGEGVADKYDESLYGDRSIDSLAKLISRTMPEDAPGTCTGEDARAVAEYIHQAFYSPEARAKLKPARVELARLTVNQYLNAVADLLPSSLNTAKVGDERGLRATYSSRTQAKEEKDRKRVSHNRRDQKIDFNFGQGVPFEDLNTNEFNINWNGSLLVEVTGTYEFGLTTENGARLWVNEDTVPLIDAWVSNGQLREEKGSVFLLGGRTYPLRINFFKNKETNASIKLTWKAPHKTWELLPEKHLLPPGTPELLIVNTPFPPDDSSQGYERGTTVSKDWHRATTYAAIEAATKIADKLDQVAGTKQDAEDRSKKIQEFCLKFAERAYRRPLEEAEKNSLSQEFQDGDVTKAAKRVIIRVLTSPEFLYVDWGRKNPDQWEVASRLSLSLWDALPDKALLEAAQKGELKTAEAVRAQAERMLKDPRAKAKVKGFFEHWLEMEEADEVTKDREAYPDFNEEVLADLRTSLEMFVNDVVWSEKSDYRDLLLADYLYLNGRLAKFYGVETSANEDFEKVSVDAKSRSGVLTHPFLLTAFSYHKSSSPIHRGVFLTRNIVGRSLKPPPMAIQFMDGRFDPSLTMREKVTELTRPNACQSCHTLINPLGFSLENFDAVGRFRTHDNNKPVDSTSEFPMNDGRMIKISGARDVAELAARSEEAHSAFTRQLFQQMVKQAPAAYGKSTLTQLQHKFAEDEFNIQKLLVNIVEVSATYGMEKQ